MLKICLQEHEDDGVSTVAGASSTTCGKVVIELWRRKLKQERHTRHLQDTPTWSSAVLTAFQALMAIAAFCFIYQNQGIDVSGESLRLWHMTYPLQWMSRWPTPTVSASTAIRVAQANSNLHDKSPKVAEPVTMSTSHVVAEGLEAAKLELEALKAMVQDMMQAEKRVRKES
jgi:hypothetical protein